MKAAIKAAKVEEEDDLVIDDSKSSVSENDCGEEELDVFDFKKSSKGWQRQTDEKQRGKLFGQDRIEIVSCVSTNEGISSKTIPGFGPCEMDNAALAEFDVPLFA